MKKTILFLLFTFSILSAQNEIIWVEVIGDTVRIWNNEVEFQCCAEFDMQVTFDDYRITIFERDTSAGPCDCICSYDLCATIIGLQTGNYVAEIFRSGESGDTTSTYIGSVLFSVTEPPATNLTIGSYQSECHDPTYIEENRDLPQKFVLSNYPNPFNSTTTISYSIPRSGYITLTVHSLLGKKITSLVNGYKEAGEYSIKFVTNNLSSGIYFYSLQLNGKNMQTRKMVYLR